MKHCSAYDGRGSPVTGVVIAKPGLCYPTTFIVNL